MSLSPDYLQESERAAMDTIIDINDYEGKINISFNNVFKLQIIQGVPKCQKMTFFVVLKNMG